MKLKKKWLTGLTLGCLSCAVIAATGMQVPEKAFADTVGGVDVSSFVMQNGAAVHKEKDGIRFTVQMNADTYENLETQESETVSVSYGMLITTSKYANAYALTEENVFGDNAKYYWAGEAGTFVDDNEQTQNQVRIVNQISPVMGRVQDAEENDPYLLYAVLTDTVPDNATETEKKAYIQGKYVSRAYIKYETKDELGEVVDTQYYFASYYDNQVQNNTRSMFQTALNRIAKNDVNKADLYTLYVAPVLGSSYKIVTQKDGVAYGEQVVNSAWTTDDILSTLSLEDYNVVSLTAEKVAGEIVLTCNFTSIYSKPVITVANASVNVYSGDGYNLLDGVSVVDEYDSNLQAVVVDDGGYNGVTVGTYTITYQATNSKGQTAIATQTVVVTADVIVEVPTNSSSAWTNGTKMNFALSKYRKLTANYAAAYTTLGAAATSGVYHNVSASSIVVDLTGGYGSAVVLDKNGVVIEARDGANGRFVNVDNPIRSNGPTSFTYNGTSYAVNANFARYMVVPAGGMAVVVYQNTFSGSDDGRTFIRNNLIEYGKVAKVYLDEETPVMYTTYENQAPVVYGNTAIQVTGNSKTQDEVDTLVLAGLSFKDDNGTFDPSDDGAITVTPTIVDRGGLDVSKAGTYTYTLTVSDGEMVRTFTRMVNVVFTVVTVQFEGQNADEFALANVVANTKVTNYNQYSLLFYTYGYKGGLGSNGYGVAMVIDADGKIVRIYDGANGKYIDKDNLGSNGYGVVNSSKCTASTYMSDALNSLQEGEIMMVAPNNSINGANARQYLLNHRLNWIGKSVTIVGVSL